MSSARTRRRRRATQLTPNRALAPIRSFFFFGGLSIHLSQALLAHLFSYNITWGATKKEVERSNFWQEVPKIIERFRVSLILSFASVFAMIILTTDVIPIGWRIFSWDWAVILPLAYVSCLVLRPSIVQGLDRWLTFVLDPTELSPGATSCTPYVDAPPTN